MKNLLITSLLLTAIVILGCGQRGTSQSTSHTYKNLSIFLIQGKDQIARNYLTLEEAMKQKKITLHETGNVGELTVDNTSQEYVFIMAGDIVKGGRQDRTIGEDIVLNPGARKVPLQSFCVEQSRWNQRGSESAAQFSSSEKTLNNKALKVAARTEKNQSKVWKEVADYQTKATEKVQAEVKSTASPTSLQLTLENDKLKNSVTEYVNALQAAFDGKSDVIGFAFFVNGKISTVETFGNAALFRKLQKKLLESAANEAFEQFDGTLKFDTPTYEQLKIFITAAEKGTETSRQTAENMMEYTKKTLQSILINSINTDAGKAALHTSIYSTDGLATNDSNSSSQFQYDGIRRNITITRR